MPVAVNANGCVPIERSHGALAERLAWLPSDAPVAILIHGFRYTPTRTWMDPHNQILGAGSWPRRMGFGRGQEGLCISFGWNASGSLWRANAEAAQAGRALAALVARLRHQHDGPVGVLAHSLGARVALAALPHLGRGDITRMALLAGAEFCDTATDALHGQKTEVLNVTSRENDGYDFLYETLMAPLSGRRAISELPSGPGAVTLQIDADDHRDGLARLGFPMRAAPRRMCHWSAYLRPGLFPLYRRFLMEPAALPLPMLRAALPEDVSPRWSRLLAKGVRGPILSLSKGDHHGTAGPHFP